MCAILLEIVSIFVFGVTSEYGGSGQSHIKLPVNSTELSPDVEVLWTGHTEIKYACKEAKFVVILHQCHQTALCRLLLTHTIIVYFIIWCVV